MTGQLRSDAAGVHVEAVAADALHGSYCPKMCTFACPVTTATGRDDAVPWGFHRTVSDLASGRLPLVPEVAERLTACSGCLGCRVPCAFDQDVPDQVRAGRAALFDGGVAAPVVDEVVRHVAQGRRPDGQAAVAAPAPDPDPTTLVVAGCRDDAATLTDVLALLRAAGERVAVTVPDGCCGSLLDDLGATEVAAAAAGRVTEQLAAAGDDATVVATDPHCLPSLRSGGGDAIDLTRHLAVAVTEGRLVARDAPDHGAVTWHDPCVLARGEGVTSAPRELLTAAGLEVHEPERSGTTTSCAGAGLGLDLLDPEAADATAAVRARDLGDGPVATACRRAADRLRAAGCDVRDLPELLVDHLVGDGHPRPPPSGSTP